MRVAIAYPSDTRIDARCCRLLTRLRFRVIHRIDSEDGVRIRSAGPHFGGNPYGSHDFLFRSRPSAWRASCGHGCSMGTGSHAPPRPQSAPSFSTAARRRRRRAGRTPESGVDVGRKLAALLCQLFRDVRVGVVFHSNSLSELQSGLSASDWDAVAIGGAWERHVALIDFDQEIRIEQGILSSPHSPHSRAGCTPPELHSGQ